MVSCLSVCSAVVVAVAEDRRAFVVSLSVVYFSLLGSINADDGQRGGNTYTM